MKKGVVISLLLILAVILGIALIDAGAKRPINWNKTFNFRDKIPYGLYVFHSEIGDILGSDKEVSDFGESIYEILDSTTIENASGKAIVEVVEYLFYDDLDTKVILDFVKNGGEFFISSTEIGESLLDTLGLQIEPLRPSLFNPSATNVRYSLGNDTSRMMLDKVDNFLIFSKLDPKTCTILGSIHARGRAIPNFIKVKYGKGNLYIHTLPEVFSNYSMLHEQRYDYVSKALNVLQSKEILLSDFYFDWEQPKTPLRVILTKPGLMQAWYILLVALVLFMLFKSKREQRAVKVVLPEPNLSKEFAKTIASLYYENGNPGNMMMKKIEYFLFSIRTTYNLDTLDLLNEKYIKQLSAKSSVSKEETYALMNLINAYKERDNCTLEELKIITQQIEDFKLKANI